MDERERDLRKFALMDREKRFCPINLSAASLCEFVLQAGSDEQSILVEDLDMA